MTVSSPRAPSPALTQNVIRAVERTPHLIRQQLCAHLKVLGQDPPPQDQDRLHAEACAQTIIHTVAITSGVVNTPPQLDVLKADSQLLPMMHARLARRHRENQ